MTEVLRSDGVVHWTQAELVVQLKTKSPLCRCNPHKAGSVKPLCMLNMPAGCHPIIGTT